MCVCGVLHGARDGGSHAAAAAAAAPYKVEKKERTKERLSVTFDLVYL